jgi:uncharacterized integral membrane protein (TIGR00698 family)
MLIAVGTSICGASAIAATAPAINAKKEEMSYAISNIAFFGLFSMIIYPYLANFLFSKNTIGVGLFLGSAIHDTSQVTGAAIIYDQIFGSTDVLKIATVTKLLRNTAMIIVIPLISIKFNTISKKSVSFKNSIKFFPIFILGFILFSTFRSIGDYFLTDSNLSFVILNENNWTTIISIIDFFSKLLLTISMAGVGLSTNLHLLKNMGLKIFYFGFFISCIVGLVSIVLIKFFIIK